MRTFFTILFLIISNIILAQVDTVKVKTGDVLYGEIKQINRKVLSMSTSYSDSDFNINFEEVKAIFINKKCNIILTKGRIRVGFVRTLKDGQISIYKSENEEAKAVFPLHDIVRLELYEDAFLKRFSANFDVGYNLTRSSNAAQFTFSGGLRYQGPGWIFSSDINSFRSRQDQVSTIQRTNANVDAKKLFVKNWYVLGSVGYLSNTQQALQSRYNSRLGLGRYIISDAKVLFSLALGYNYNQEDFSEVANSRSSNELFANLNWSLFDFKNIDLTSKIYYYPSISKSNRHRIDYVLDVKYQLPYDIYIKAGLQFNYDNQPVLIDTDFDYIFTSGLGWKFN